MNRVLDGHTILIVEDQPLIALDVAQALEEAGAKVTTTNTLKHAVILAEQDSLSGAILDHVLSDGDSTQLCSRLKERDIPFVIYSGYARIGGVCQEGVHVTKPATPEHLVTVLSGLLFGKLKGSDTIQ